MKKFALIVLLLVSMLLTSIIAAQGPDPDHTGELEVSGLNDTVEILRDEWGVPHIYASNTYDLFFAQGYTQAMDRWWQMEFFRATGRGSIQELTGFNESLMGTDAFLRTMGFVEVAERELAENYDEESLAILEAFADGVNAYIMNRDQSELAMQYRLLGVTGVSVEIEPWTPVDTLIWGKVMALDLGGNRGSELRLSNLMANLEADLLADYVVDWPFGDKPTIVLPEDLPITEETADTDRTEVAEAGIVGIETAMIGDFEMEGNPFMPFGYGSGIGSNNWVAAGSITDTGMPLMANDMHLGIQMPSIWYEIGLHCAPVSDECPFNVAGFTFAPTPMIVAGHNDDISWALTNVGPDVQDLYQIRVNPDNPLQYEWNGEWRDMTVRDEMIEFGNDVDPVPLQVRMTHHGPIINDTLESFNNENPLALRWTALEPGQIFVSFRLLNTAENWADFREALSFFDSPAQNFIYADTEGNIGYQTPGRTPIRAPEHTGLLPVPGWTDETEWLGYMPYDNLPRIYNPDRGWIGTANQAVVPLEYYDQVAQELADEFGTDANYFISRQWAYGYRGDRVNTLLADMQPHSIDTFREMLGDNYDGSAAEILPFLAEVTFEDSMMAEARDWLMEWDYHMDMDSPQAALYAGFWSSLAQNLYNDELAGFARASGDNVELWATYLLMQDPENAWWDDVSTADVTETRDDIIARSFEEGYATIAELLGEDREAWQWGALHTTTFVSNPLGVSGIAPIENQVNRGPVETAGTNIAINATSWSMGTGNFTVRSGPSERVVYDLSNWDNSISMHTTGQSGHPASDNYDDMIDPWRFVEFRPMPFSREGVEAVTRDTLILNPGE